MNTKENLEDHNKIFIDLTLFLSTATTYEICHINLGKNVDLLFFGSEQFSDSFHKHFGIVRMRHCYWTINTGVACAKNHQVIQDYSLTGIITWRLLIR